MYSKPAVTAMITLYLTTGLVGCQQSSRHEPLAGPSPQAANTTEREPGWAIGWSVLKAGMDPVEVLSVLDEPAYVRVTKINTFWYYSDRLADGPHVVFNTRSMRVDRWRSPGKR